MAAAQVETFPVWVETCLDPRSTAMAADVMEHVMSFLASLPVSALTHNGLLEFRGHHLFLDKNVATIRISDTDEKLLQKESIDKQNLAPQISVYQLNEDGPGEEMADEQETVAAAQQWILPNREFEGTWDSLIYDSDVKDYLLSYVSTATLLADRNVDPNIIGYNRVVLLHGPPGTGKTSLCKALAQKLSVRLGTRYTHGQLVEINAHSLFSKWFSESGKLVMKLFGTIREMIEDENALVFVLIDEVESLTTARTSAMSGSEPSDAIRVVNAVLTQIDQIRSFKNVVILTTSNITGAIDLAFVDRADIKRYLGPPSLRARYLILHSCVTELSRVEVIQAGASLLTFDALDYLEKSGSVPSSAAVVNSHKLKTVANRAEGLSGRALRKLPFLALVHVQTGSCDMARFLEALDWAVTTEQGARQDMETKHV